MSLPVVVHLTRLEREALELVVTRADALCKLSPLDGSGPAALLVERLREALSALAKLRGGTL